MESNTKISYRGFRGEGMRRRVSGQANGRVMDFLDMVRKALDNEFCFGRVEV
jgi:hypothetical protein